MEHWNQNYLQLNKNPGIISFVSHHEEQQSFVFSVNIYYD